MKNQVLFGFLLWLFLAQSSSSVVLADFGVREGDQFEFHSNNALFREWDSNGVVNDFQGFMIYGVFISEFIPFHFDIANIESLDAVSLDLEINQTDHRIEDTLQFFVHDTDWSEYLGVLESKKVLFDNLVLHGELLGSFDIIDEETEIGYRQNSELFIQYQGDNYHKETKNEVVRYERSTGVIWEHSNDTRIETSTNNIEFTDWYIYSFQRDVEYVTQTDPQVIIPGFTVILAVIPLFVLVLYRKSRTNII